MKIPQGCYASDTTPYKDYPGTHSLAEGDPDGPLLEKFEFMKDPADTWLVAHKFFDTAWQIATSVPVSPQRTFELEQLLSMRSEMVAARRTLSELMRHASESDRWATCDSWDRSLVAALVAARAALESPGVTLRPLVKFHRAMAKL